MPLNGKYSPGELCLVLDKKTRSSRALFKMDFGGAIRPYYYEADRALILSPATDIDDPLLLSVDKVIGQAGEAVKSVIAAGNAIIIPVVEQQRLLFFPRKHWVTLHYDVQSKIGTLIDSRPWHVSFLYPTNTLWEMFTEGCNAIGVEAPLIERKMVYQGVQLNDIYCGSWVLANILSLVGVFEQGVSPKTVDELKTTFDADDEISIINKMIDCSGDESISKLVPVIGDLERSLVYLGLSTYKTMGARDLFTFEDGFESSHVKLCRSLAGGHSHVNAEPTEAHLEEALPDDRPTQQDDLNLSKPPHP